MHRPPLVVSVCLLISLSGCASPAAVGGGLLNSSKTPTSMPATPRPSPTPPPTATATPIQTSTPPVCLSQPGSVQSGEIDAVKPSQLFLIYLPPCYDQRSDLRYPVLYLLHGQTSIDDQWVRMGAPTAADSLIHSGQAAPFIMVFPDDRYWNLPPGPAFGDRLVNLIVPYVDAHYRTLPDAQHRALGGLSRGGGWAIHMLLTHYALFGIIGLHSPVIFDADNAVLERAMSAVPSDEWPRIWIDGGDRDGGLGDIRRFESLLTAYEVPHEWHLYSGDHTEPYWRAHLREYLVWYTQQLASEGTSTPSVTSTP
jgi:enterochelin esterase-like enzyme